MGLDLANKNGRAHNTVPVTDLSTITEATFNSGDVDKAGKFLVQVDTSGGDLDVGNVPATMPLPSGEETLIDGVEMTIVKVTTDGNRLMFNDPVTGIDYNYVNRQGESLTLVFDTSTGAGQWVAQL